MRPYVSKEIPPGAEILSRKSWVCYLAPLTPPCLLLLGAYPLYFHAAIAGGLLALSASTLLIYSYAETRSACLYIDKKGVWEFSGILPWSKGVRGVRWRDLDEATYSMSAIGWLLNNYDVSIRHRYKKDYGLSLTGLYKGDKAAREINKRHSAKICSKHSL